MVIMTLAALKFQSPDNIVRDNISLLSTYNAGISCVNSREYSGITNLLCHVPKIIIYLWRHAQRIIRVISELLFQLFLFFGADAKKSHPWGDFIMKLILAIELSRHFLTSLFPIAQTCQSDLDVNVFTFHKNIFEVINFFDSFVSFNLFTLI